MYTVQPMQHKTDEVNSSFLANSAHLPSSSTSAVGGVTVTHAPLVYLCVCVCGQG